MTQTREALSRLQAALTLLPRAFVLPDRSESQRMLEVFGAKDREAASAPAVQMEALRRRLLEAFSTGRPSTITRRDLRDAPWILWNGASPGAALPPLMDAVFAAGQGSPRITRAMIEAWLRDFSLNNPTIAAGGHAIQRLLSQHNDASLVRWQAAEAKFHLFDAVQGPPRLAEALLSSRDSVPTVWAQACLDDEFRAAGGYARSVLVCLTGALPSSLRGPRSDALLARALEALAPGDAPRFGREQRGDVGRGLLGAWLDPRGGPPVALRDPVRDFLLRHLGDPRLRAAEWTPVGEAATALMRQWLARASLKAFFDVIADHALDHQWRYREAFWSACLEKGGIQDAWLALGRHAYSSARAVKELSGAYGKLEGGGATSDQSVLLMRVGPLVLCEWSHNGKLRAWPAEWANAPKLYRSIYSRTELVGKGLPFPPNPLTASRGASDGFGLSHIGSANDTWQGSAAELLLRRAGLQLTREEWRP